MGFCPSGRLFEAAACGTPILTDCWDGLEEFFTPDSEILVANTSQEAIEALCLSPAKLAEISRAARERTLVEHTAERRAIDLELALETASQTSETILSEPCR